MSASTLLERLLRTTIPASLTSDVTIDSGPAHGSMQKLHLASRFAVRPDGVVERDVMGRVVAGNPANLRFLIEQRIAPAGPPASPHIWVATAANPTQVTQEPFDPWTGLPGTELKNFDFVLPVPSAATILDPAPAPSPDGTLPPAGCVVVEMVLAPVGAADGSDRILLWIEDLAERTMDHRAEHYRNGALVRVMTSHDWQPLPGTPNWGPVRRSTLRVSSGRTSTVTVTSANPAPLAPDIFTPPTLPSGTW